MRLQTNTMTKMARSVPMVASILKQLCTLAGLIICFYCLNGYNALREAILNEPSDDF